MLDQGATFVFSFWICVTNGTGGFNSHLADSREPETLAATQHSDLDEFIDNLNKMLLPDFAREIEEESVLDAILTHAAPGLLGSDLIRSGEERTRVLFRLCNAPSFYQDFLFALEEDLDNLLKIGEEGATVCREAPVFDKYSDSNNDSKPFSGHHISLTITSMPQGRFLYWKGMEPSELSNMTPALWP
jgi:hypothetical protein